MMNRREMLKALAGTVAVLGTVTHVGATKYGRIYAGGSLDRQNNVTVLLDGEDVTRHCRMADDIEGECELYKVNDGHHYYDVDTDDAAKERRRGRVVITVGPRDRPWPLPPTGPAVHQ